MNGFTLNVAAGRREEDAADDVAALPWEVGQKEVVEHTRPTAAPFAVSLPSARSCRDQRVFLHHQ